MHGMPQNARGKTGNSENRTTRILVIDDDACVGLAIKTILATRSCDAVLTLRADDGIRALQQSSFDIVMVDIFMPGMCGLDTIEQIRRGSSTPIIAMSGFRLRNPAASVDYLGMAALKGATVTIRKPFNAGQLINAVEWIRSMQGHTGGSVH